MWIIVEACGNDVIKAFYSKSAPEYAKILAVYCLKTTVRVCGILPIFIFEVDSAILQTYNSYIENV